MSSEGLTTPIAASLPGDFTVKTGNKSFTFNISGLTDSILRTCTVPNSDSRLIAVNSTSIATASSLPSGANNTFYGIGAGSDVTTGTSNTVIGQGSQAGSATATSRFVLGGTGLYNNSTHINTTGIDAPNLESATSAKILYFDSVTGKITQGDAPSGATASEMADGSAEEPALKFLSAQTTGFYKYTDGLGISVGGNSLFKLSSINLTLNTYLAIDVGDARGLLITTNSDSTPPAQISNGATTGNVLDVLQPNTVNGTKTGQILFGRTQDPDDFAYMAFIPGATQYINFGMSSKVLAISSAGQILPGVGSAAAPSFSFESDPDTGFYRSAADSLAITAGGTLRAFFATGGLRSNSSSYELGGAANPFGTVYAGTYTPHTDNTFSCGTNSNRFTAVWALNGTIQTSDRNQKELIEECPLGLDFIKRLAPKRYKWKDRTTTQKKWNEEKQEFFTEEVKVQHHRKNYGLIAQDVKQVLDDLQIATQDAAFYIDTSVNDPNNPQQFGLNYVQLIAPIIKAIQELAAQVAALQG